MSTLSKPSKILDNDSRMGPPCGIAFSSNGKWAVADYSNRCVCLYDGDDQLVREIGNGKYIYPKGVKFDNEDHLYTTAYHKVQKFTTEGDYLLEFGRHGSDDGE